MNRARRGFQKGWVVLGLLALFLAVTGCGDGTFIPPNPPEVNSPHEKGQTDFVTDEDGNGTSSNGGDFGEGGPQSGAAPSAPNTDSGAREDSANKSAPSGRTGTVEEADLYRTFGNLMFYLNTYKGLTLFDLKDPKNPKKLYNLPVYGYPIEMFVEKNTVYALVRDALYMMRTNGKFEFHRRNVSQLITIDITNPKQPRILQRFDIKGQLREGVSRKIDNTIYVVSFTPRYYYWGWYYGYQPRANDQATVYSFNVKNPKNVQKIQSLDLIKDAPKPNTRQPDGSYESSNFNGITISATANALLVGERWYYRKYKYNSNWRCNEYENSQYTIMNVVNISDVNGKINLHTRFKVKGDLTDQFKQTYIFDEAKNRGVYYGIFRRQEWQRSGCSSSSLVKNTLVSLDISDGNNPKVLDELAFGKPNETVRGSLFDRDRGVAYAITAERIDPLYAISIKDPSNLKVMSEIDGLSGDINLFRFVENRKFLLAIGRDNSSSCEGFGSDRVGTNLAVSLIDVRNLSKIRLVQRKCVAIKGAKWVNSEINWNLDQAHKMIGQHQMGTTHLLTVPVSYYSRSENGGSWWWYEYKSAIGIMKWDLTKYDDTKDHTQQNVLENVGTMIHPKGSVKRTIILELGDTQNKRRVVANLSDTHMSLVDFDDLKNPSLLSMYEIAPYIRSVYRFGNYVVERVNLGQSYDQYNEFRIKRLDSGNVNDSKAVSAFIVGQIRQVMRHGNYLLLFRGILKYRTSNGKQYPYFDYNKTELLVYDLSDPLNPRARGSVVVPYGFYPYYPFYCGLWRPYDFNYYSSSQFVKTKTGIVNYFTRYDSASRTNTSNLLFVDISNPDKPTFNTKELAKYSYNTSQYQWPQYFTGLVSLDDGSFYVTLRKAAGSYKKNNYTYYRYRYFAQQWSWVNGSWLKGSDINVPGQLIKAFRVGSKVRLLTRDYGSIQKRYEYSPGQWSSRYQRFFRIYLLDQSTDGKKAILRDFRSFLGWDMGNLLTDGNRMYLTTYRDWYYLHTNKLDYSHRTAHLHIYDMTTSSFRQRFVGDTRANNLQIMGAYNKRLFLNLQGDGVLVVDTQDASKPKGTHFERTLGWVTHVEFSGDKAFMAAGHFGIYTLNLKNVNIPAL
ncbi:MAG: hypothetical protein EP343_23690 [Deltaproteobacteria bacterium]|nr:MAG: hypothetical protein EP343_23690 [Deltaproteobacteria bacterium]